MSRDDVLFTMRTAAAVLGGKLVDVDAPYPRCRFPLRIEAISATYECYAYLDPEWQHPEYDGMVRVIADRNGMVLARSFTAGWAALYGAAHDRLLPLR